MMPGIPKHPLEFYGRSTDSGADWADVFAMQQCSFLLRRCVKQRKSDPSQTIGSCILGYKGAPVVVCPHRFLSVQQIFLDALPLLRHEPGCELHVVAEVTLPGGSVDYFVVVACAGAVVDYAGLEIQALDTTGSGAIWRARQDLAAGRPLGERYRYGMNWKMSAKTALLQLHHKAETFAALGRKLVVVIQDVFQAYIEQEFTTSRLHLASSQDSVHFHVYRLDGELNLRLAGRLSTDLRGVAEMLGLKASALIDEQDLVQRLQAKISAQTLLVL